MGVQAILLVYSCGAVVLAIWLVARFPTFGPDTIMGSTAMLLGALVVAALVPAFVQVLVGDGSRLGGLVGLVGLVLPTLAAIFWSAARLMRAMCNLLPGAR
jgi:hypothetical protein